MSRVVSHNYIAELPVKEQVPELRRITRELYSTPNGAIVLSALLQDLHWTKETATSEQVALRNFAAYYLKERLGINLGHDATVALLNQYEE